MKMERLGDLKTWAEVQSFFTNAEERRLKSKDPVELENLHAMKRFRMNASFDAPGYDLRRRSIQSVAVEWFERERKYRNAKSRLVEENEKRLMMGFRTACLALLGPDWANETDFLRREQDYAEAYYHNTILAYGGKANPFLKKELVWPDLPPTVHRTLVRHWTNPDFPLWLMTNQALSQSIRYLTGIGDLMEASVSTTLDRLGLDPLRDRPIKRIFFTTEKRRKFKGYEFVSYLKEELESVVITTRGREESRQTALDGRHFLCNEKFPLLPIRRKAIDPGRTSTQPKGIDPFDEGETIAKNSG